MPEQAVYILSQVVQNQTILLHTDSLMYCVTIEIEVIV